MSEETRASSEDIDSGLTTRFLVILMMAASFVMVLWNLQDSSLENANTGSRYATIESLVDFKTYHIDASRYVRTIDKMKVDGHYISSKPAALPTFGAAVYWVFQKLTGRTIALYEGQVVWLVSFFTGLMFHMVFLIYFYRLAALLMKKQLAILGAMAVACFGYLGVAYATAINNHSPAAALAIVGLFYAYRAHAFNDRRRDWVFAGLALGVTGAIDLTSLAFIPCVGLYLLRKDWRRAFLLYGAGVLPGIVVMFGLNYYITGSFKPTYTNSDLKNFAGNYFRGGRRGIDGLKEPKYIYAWNVLMGHHGLFSMTPVYLFAAYEIVQRLRKRLLVPETLVIVGVLSMFLGFYIFRTRSYGGWCVGMRWLIPVMPLLVLYFGLWLDRVRTTRTVIAATTLAFAVGCFHVQDGLTSPFQFSVWHNWLEGQPNRNRVGKKFNLPSPKRIKKAKAQEAAAPL